MEHYTAMPAHLTETDIRDYQQCGVVVIRNALTPEQVETLKRGINRAYKNSNVDPDATADDMTKDSKKVFVPFPCYRDHPEYREILFHSELPKIAAQLTGSRTIRLHHVEIHVEVPNTRERTPWHTDELFYNVGGNQSLSLFVAVDPMPKGNAEFILGSHRWPATMPRYLRERYAKNLTTGEVPEPPNVEAMRKELPVVSWDLRPGDCIVFSFRTMHLLRAATALRRGMSARYVGDDATYQPRPWVTFPCLPELERDLEGMKAGGPLRHSIFPIAYTREANL
jgi:ectoine hydroxylase-related dioxygenase (phytanoyl-CoA dioxygenase family)